MEPPACVLGFAPHSGWTVLVIVGGTSAAPRLLLRERIELADQRLAGSKQPYHYLEGRPLAEAQRRLALFEESASALALGALRTLTHTVRAAGEEPRAAGIIASSGRVGATLEATLASHALIHTADGNHFRDALGRACMTLGLPVTRMPQRALREHAAAGEGRARARLGRTLGRRSESRGAAGLAPAMSR